MNDEIKICENHRKVMFMEKFIYEGRDQKPFKYILPLTIN